MLLQERGRLVITLVGIIFSTVLTLIEMAIYLGMMGNATASQQTVMSDDNSKLVPFPSRTGQ